MGSSETVLRNLELLSMQYRAQREWAQQAVLTAMDGVRHFRQLSDSYKSDCREAMQAKASVASFERAAGIFGEVVAACSRVIAEINREMAA
jgi:hypothetical protein